MKYLIPSILLMLSTPFLLVIALVVHMGGSSRGDSELTLWNILPVVLGLAVFFWGVHAARSAATRSAAALGATGRISFGVSITLMLGLYHLAWLYDWNGTRSSGPRTVIAFILCPIVVFFCASIIAVFTWAITPFIVRRRLAAIKEGRLHNRFPNGGRSE